MTNIEKQNMRLLEKLNLIVKSNQDLERENSKLRKQLLERESGKRDKSKLEWYVYKYDSNRLIYYNIFQHGGFYDALIKLKKEYLGRKHFNPDLFFKKVAGELQYYFWSKCEYEIVICPWPRADDRCEKVDIYQQVLINSSAFKKYLLDNYKNIK